MGFEVDLKRFERQMNDIERKVLPIAAAGYLNEIAFQSKTALRQQMETDFDRPNPFTMSAFAVQKAKPADGQDMHAAVFARPDQAEYLYYQIFGGVRRKGDAGSLPFDLLVDADKEDKFGGVPRRYLRRTSAKLKKERSERAALRSQRKAARMAGQPTEALRWVKKSRNRPGVFFGEVGGVRGYWQRPKRSKAAKKRVVGVRSVREVGRLRLLLRMSDAARYEPGRFKYGDAVLRTHKRFATSERFGKEVSRQIRKLKS